jgi:tRNA modification GTPase
VTNTIAAVTTGKGTGAIAVIELFGRDAEAVLKKIFCRTGGKEPQFQIGKIFVGSIKNGKKIIDHVTIGCEGRNHFAINCHGNPLIVADIMALLRKKGVKPVSDKKLLYEIFSQDCANTIEVEAKLAQLNAKTLSGTKIILNQIDSGLSKIAKKWLEKISKQSPAKIRNEAEQVLKNTKIAKPIICGLKIALAGPPNTGKSTLLNFLVGRQKSIVADIAGTTRDFVTAECRIGPLFAQVIDTAGLAGRWMADGRGQRAVEKIAQKRSMEVLGDADLVLLIIDNSRKNIKPDRNFLKAIFGKSTIVVLNKSDKPARFRIQSLPPFLSDIVKISAKTGAGVDKLLAEIRRKTKVDDFDLNSPVCITARQENFVKKLIAAKSKPQSARLITELLNGRLCV